MLNRVYNEIDGIKQPLIERFHLDSWKRALFSVWLLLAWRSRRDK